MKVSAPKIEFKVVDKLDLKRKKCTTSQKVEPVKEKTDDEVVEHKMKNRKQKNLSLRKQKIQKNKSELLLQLFEQKQVS